VYIRGSGGLRGLSFGAILVHVAGHDVRHIPSRHISLLMMPIWTTFELELFPACPEESTLHDVSLSCGPRCGYILLSRSSSRRAWSMLFAWSRYCKNTFFHLLPSPLTRQEVTLPEAGNHSCWAMESCYRCGLIWGCLSEVAVDAPKKFRQGSSAR
jgi:hypothetical protein